MERLRNLLLGLSALSWAVLGLVHAGPEDRYSVVRLSIASLNLCVGMLFLVRGPVKQDGSTLAVMVALPSLLIGGWALNVSPAFPLWPWYAESLFAVGAAWAIFAFVTLGSSFAILPALRGIVVSGPFRCTRHPAYGGEMLLALACWLARPSWFAIAPFLTSIPMIAARILAEERLLMKTPEYRAYARQVRWRLIPYVW